MSVLAVAVCLGATLPAQSPSATFRSGASVVLVPVWVTDKNRQVTGLTAADFQLLDNGVPQEISIVEASSRPVDVTLVLDTSGSLQASALDTVKTGVQQIALGLRPTDAVRLLAFASSVVDVFGVRAGGAPLPIDRLESGGGTSFYHALAAALITTPRNDRAQLVFAVSDGLDNQSFLDARQLIAIAESTSAALYVTLVEPPSSRPASVRPLSINTGIAVRPLPPSTGRLREAAARTGGMLYEDAAGTALPRLFTRVLEDFRMSYLLSYTPRGIRSGGRHEIAVRTKDGRYTVRARKSYQE